MRPQDIDSITSTLAVQGTRSPLQFITCGGSGDGKSTLIGRLLYDSKLVLEDHRAPLAGHPPGHGAAGNDIDLAGLVGKLDSERQQGIGSDVTYRVFSTAKRRFLVADPPGDEQNTRTMVAGASNSELAIVFVDCRKGILPQTRRHAYIASLMGIRHVLLAVNKIDLVNFSEDVFAGIDEAFREFAEQLDFAGVTSIPVSARYGDNVVARSQRTPWYRGPSVLEYLEGVDVETVLSVKPFRMPVESRNEELGGLCGTVVSGTAAIGDSVIAAKSGRVSRVARIVTAEGDVAQVGAGGPVTLVLADKIDISRGDVLASPQARPEYADQFAAHLLWISDEELLPHRQYLIKLGAETVPAHVTQLKHRVDVNTLEHIAARTLKLDEIGYCNISTAAPVAFDAYRDNRQMGGFIVIDRYTNAAVGVGTIEFGLRRATNVHWQALDVNAGARANLKGQRPCVIWFTGLSGSGKSTIANLVEKRLFGEGRHTYLLDGDNVRHGLNRDLGFTEADRVENIRRVAETAKLFADAGLITLVSFISPFRSERRMARELLQPGQFIEVFIDTPIELCMSRDPKGLYKRAMAGEIRNFTGIDSPYERPEAAEIVLRTETDTPDALAESIVEYLKEQGFVR